MNPKIYKAFVLIVVGLLVAGAAIYKVTQKDGDAQTSPNNANNHQPDTNNQSDPQSEKQLPTLLYLGRFL